MYSFKAVDFFLLSCRSRPGLPTLITCIVLISFITYLLTFSNLFFPCFLYPREGNGFVRIDPIEIEVGAGRGS